jgi:hypothetical protein
MAASTLSGTTSPTKIASGTSPRNEAQQQVVIPGGGNSSAGINGNVQQQQQQQQVGPTLLYGEGGVPAMVRYTMSLLMDADEGGRTDVEAGKTVTYISHPAGLQEFLLGL